MDKVIDDVVNSITNSEAYKKCLEIKEKMKDNTDISTRVNKIKRLQKEYIRSNDENILKELDNLKEELNSIPIYHMYNQYLEEVNQMISYVNDELNNYFNNLFN